MRDFLRVGATGFVWVVFAFFMLGLFAMASDTYSTAYYLLAMAITATLALFAFFLTARIWGRAEARAAVPASRARSRSAAAGDSKAKRDYAARLETLMETLDEDEIIELESLLAAREAHATGRAERR